MNNNKMLNYVYLFSMKFRYLGISYFNSFGRQISIYVKCHQIKTAKNSLSIQMFDHFLQAGTVSDLVKFTK